MRVKIYLVIIIIALILSGCFKGEQSLKSMDEPKEANEVNDLDNINNNNDDNNSKDDDDSSNSGKINETVERELYLVDLNGMVVAQKIDLPVPETKEVAIQVLEHLVKGGPITNLLPNGFQAVLPEGTEILSLSLQEDGTLIVDLSEEFANYEANEEMKILESMTFTLTQFDSIDRIKLQINGHPITKMPVDGTPINDGYSRANGINFIKTNTIDFIASKPVTMYYPGEYNGNHYYIPITQHVKSEDDNIYSAIVNALITGPRYDVNVTHVFNDQTILLEPPMIQDGVLHLIFNENILKDSEKAIIADEVMETLTRTLTEQRSVDAINVKVENTEILVNENGEAYDEPVTTQTFNPTEKM